MQSESANPRLTAEIQLEQKIRTVLGKPRDACFPKSCSTHRVQVLAITILVSSCLAAIFVVCFAIEAYRGRNSSFERDSLLPLDSTKPSSNKS